ncbi:hypothetical protein CJ030_MR2G004712 [Morella rubra]|uniref:Uncharacterized protein n=1 Tax=Morella rubra TaxID=262757 RepID=A0A6A1WH35_9ROSI|nr:hypothetical protein CJ030_MR2G004712 [Morella rubra]
MFSHSTVAAEKSINSTITERKMRIFRSDLNTQSVPDPSTESLRRTSFPILSQRPSNLRVFTVSELKSATRNFSLPDWTRWVWDGLQGVDREWRRSNHKD